MMQNTSEASYENAFVYFSIHRSRTKMKLSTGIFKTAIAKTAIAASLMAMAFGVQAQTVSDANVTITGDFTASCSLSGNNVALGSADLPAYMNTTLASQHHVRYPIDLGVTCNASTIPWRLYNINSVALTIGSVTTNEACIADAAQTAHGGYHRCAGSLLATNGSGYISGTGSMTKPVHLLIWHSGTPQLPYRGTGSISAVIPMRMEY